MPIKKIAYNILANLGARPAEARTSKKYLFSDCPPKEI
jgi:hypothetical protein